jgi:dihydrofolate synthase/folylpolyglutamate synthase
MKIWRVPYRKFGAGSGLARVVAIAERLELDLTCFGARGAAIVGTNGKGSTAVMTAALLQQTGASVGLFTSPHLFALNERFRVDGEDIGDSELAYHWARVVAAADEAGLSEQLGGFEFLFLIAADWFAARACAHTIWEAGIGGRLDTVRLIQARRLALTSLDLEHTELLGDTLADIARDKLDASPDGATVFVSDSCLPQRQVIEAHCAARGARAVLVGAETLGAFTPSLSGAHQRDNAALAVAIARDIKADALGGDEIARGLAATRWPGRLEVLNDEPLIVIDVGHTPAAIRVALEGFNTLRGARPGVLVCGASHDKDAGAMIAALAPGFGVIVCASALHKGAPAAAIAAYASAANPSAEIACAASLAEARTLALARARSLDGVIYVAGGLFLAAEFKAVHLGRDPASLAFF